MTAVHGTTLPRGAALLLLLCVACACGADSHVTTYFAFQGRLLSIRLPSLHYWVMTSVEEGRRTILVSFPPLPPAEASGPRSATLTVVLRVLPAPTDPEAFLAQTMNELFADRNAVVSELTRALSLSLQNASWRSVRYGTDDAFPHRALLVTAMDSGLAVVMLVDALASEYAQVEDSAIDILGSIRLQE